MRTRILIVVAAIALAGAITASAQRQTVREIMHQVVIPEATAILGIKEPPRGAAAWSAVRRRAERLASAGQQLLPAAPTSDREEWIVQVRAYVRAAGEVQVAADRKNFEALLAASDHLAATCVNCHLHFLQEKQP